MPKLFTIEEATALLPQLREILDELRQAVELLERAEREVAEHESRVRGNGHRVPDEAYAHRQAARAAVQREIELVHSLGCELKDLRLGLIDFPSRREGEVVHLCWKRDEPAIAFWHPLETGFAGRQPL